VGVIAARYFCNLSSSQSPTGVGCRVLGYQAAWYRLPADKLAWACDRGQHAVIRLAVNKGYAQIGPDDCVVHGSNTAFDASTFEIWAAWLNGASVLIVPNSFLLDSHALVSTLKRHKATVLWLTVGVICAVCGRAV